MKALFLPLIFTSTLAFAQANPFTYSAQGTHRCNRATDLNNTYICRNEGAGYASCEEAYNSLSAIDCCHLVVGPSDHSWRSIGFELTRCTPEGCEQYE